MLTIPEKKVIVAFTPRTGSRALDAAIRKGCSRRSIPYTVHRLHHPFPHVLKKEADKKGYEIWTIIREPMSHLGSWMKHAAAVVSHHGPMKFIMEYDSRYFYYQGAMNIYSKETDRFFVYEEDGHRTFMEALDMGGDHVPVIGKSEGSHHVFTPGEEEQARRRFHNDFELYERIKSMPEPRRVQVAG